MALNPLIRSISSQKAAPDEHIHRFLHSMSPYVQQHAQFGQKSFERDVIGAGTEGKGQLTSSSQEKGTEWMPTGKELRARLERRSGREGKAKEEAEGSKSWELIAGCYPPSGMEIHKKRQSSHEYLDYQHHSRPAPNLQGVRESRIRPDDPKDFGVESLAPNTNPQPAREPESRGASPQNLGTQRERLKESYVEETETAIRRLHRKLRRRDKAAILKPKQPSPSPSPLPPGEVARNKTWAGPSLETQDDDHETPSVDRKRRRAKTHRAGPALEILRSYQSQNVHAGRGRLTLKPSSRPGFLSKGKASAPLQVLSRQAAKRRSKAYLHGYDDTDGSDHLDIVHDDLAILGIRAPVPSHDEEELEQQLRRHPKKVKNMYTLSNHSDAFKQNSYNSSPDTRQSDHRDFLPTHFRTVNRRLPSTGITGSPSWPSIPKTETSTHQHQSSLLPSSQADQRQVRISDPNVKIRIGRRIYSTKDEAGPERDMRHLGTQGGHQANPTFAHSGGYNTFPIQSGASQHEMAYGQIIPRDLAPQYEADDVIYASRGNNLKQLYLTPQRPSDKVGNPRHDDPAVDGSVPSDARLRAESSFMMTPNDPPVWTVPFHSSNRSTSSRTPLNPSFGAAIQADLYLIGTSGDDQPQHASRDNVYDIGGHSHHHPGNIPVTDDWQVQNLQVLPRTPRHSDTYPHIVWDPYSHPSSDHERADLFSQPPQPSLLDREDSFREDPFQSSYHEPYQAQFLPAILENREDEENIPPSACDSATPDDAMYVDLTETAAEEVKMFGASGEEWKKLWQSRRNVL